MGANQNQGAILKAAIITRIEPRPFSSTLKTINADVYAPDSPKNQVFTYISSNVFQVFAQCL